MKEIEEVALKLIEYLKRGEQAPVQQYLGLVDVGTGAFLLMTVVSLLMQQGRGDLILLLRGVAMAAYFSTGSGQWKRLVSQFAGQVCLFCGGIIKQRAPIYWRKLQALEKYNVPVDGDAVTPQSPSKSLVAHVPCFLMSIPVESMPDDMLRESVEVIRDRYHQLQEFNEQLVEKLQEAAKWGSSAGRSSLTR